MKNFYTLVFTVITLFLLGCGKVNDVAVTGGTQNNVDVNVCINQVTTTLDSRTCLRQLCGTDVRAGSCTDPTLVYDPILTIFEMNEIRDFAVLPCTTEEELFLSQAVCL